MKNMLLRNTLRTVRRTPGRFFSIFAIIAIGSGFFAGVKVTSPDMKHTADDYYADTHLADLHLKSNVGFSADEIARLREYSGVRGVAASAAVDCFLPAGDGANEIVRAYSMDFAAAEAAADDAVNLPVLLKGRYPAAPDECLIEVNTPTEYHVGDTLTLLAGSSEASLTDTLTTDTFTIVGEVNWSQHVNFERGTTTIGNGTVSSFLLLPPDAFCTTLYTDVFLTLESTRGLYAYGDAYDDAVADFSARLEDDAPEIYALRAEELRQDAAAKLDDADRQLAAGQADYDQAKADYEIAIAAGEQQLADAEQALAAGQAEYDTGKKAYDDGIAAAEAAEKELTAQAKTLSEQKTSLATQQDALTSATKLGNKLQSAVINYNSSCTLPPFDDTTAQMIAASQTLDSNAFSFSETLGEYISAPVGSALKARDYQLLWAAIGNYTNELSAQQETLDGAVRKLKTAEKQLTAAQKTLEAKQTELKAAEKKLAESQKTLQDSEATLTASRTELEANRASGAAELQEAQKKLTDSAAEIAEGRAALTDIAGSISWYYLDRSYNIGYDSFEEDANRVDSIAQVFPVFFILVAALVCLTTMTRMVEEQRTEIGTLKALGYSRGSIMLQYLLYAATASVLGVFVGMIVCTNVFPRAIFTAYTLMYNLPDIQCPWHWGYALGSLAVSLLCTAAASLGACRRALVSVPAQLMRPCPPKNGKRVLLERCTHLWKHLSFNIKITARNVFRYKSRVLMTIVGVAGCTALMLTGFGLRNGITVIVDLQFGDIFNYDVMTVFDGDAPEDAREAYCTEFAQDEAMEQSLNLLLKSATARGDGAAVSATLFVPQSTENLGTMVTLRDRTDHTAVFLTEDGAVLTEKLARLLDVQVGDTLSFDNTTQTIRVADITENYVFHYIYLTPAQYEQLFGTYTPNACCGTLQPGASEDALSERLLTHDCVLSVAYTAGSGNTFRELVKSLNVIVLLIIFSSGALAFVVLYNLANINITERVRELATIKVLGFYDGEVAAYIYRENTVSALLGMGGGLILGIFLNRFVITTSEIDAVMFYPVLPAHAYLCAALLTLGFTVLVNALLYFKLRRIDMAGSMKAIE